MKERPFQKRIEDMLDLFGYKWWHVPAPMQYAPSNKAWVPARNAAGLCDIIAFHHDPPIALFIELKGDGGKLSDQQKEFLQAAKNVADDVREEYEMAPEDLRRAMPIGVYAWWPQDEPIAEQILKSRVLI